MQVQALHHTFLELTKTYGKIFGFWVGSQYIVVFNGYEALHQALVKQSDVFSDRANFLPGFKRNLKEETGISFASYYHRWKSCRRFTHQALPDFSIGNQH